MSGLTLHEKWEQDDMPFRIIKKEPSREEKINRAIKGIKKLRWLRKQRTK